MGKNITFSAKAAACGLEWDVIEAHSGVDRATIDRIAALYGTSKRTIFDVNKELIVDNIKNVSFTEALCQNLNELNGRKGVHEGPGIHNGWLKLGDKKLGL